MHTMYKAIDLPYKLEIVAYPVARTTAHYVFHPPEPGRQVQRREAKVSSNEAWFPTWAAARKWLFDRQQEDVWDLQVVLANRRARLEAVRAMTDPTGNGSEEGVTK